MSSKRIASVPRTFAEQLTAFVARAKAEGWARKNGIDVATLDTDGQLQQAEKQKRIELDQEMRQFKKKFRVDEAARYRRFRTALNVVRSAYQEQPEVIDSLVAFKRPSRSARMKAPPNSPPAPVAA